AALHAPAAPGRAWEVRRGCGSGRARRWLGWKLLEPGTRGSGAQDVVGALGVNLSSGSHASRGSSRRRCSRRGPRGCRRTAAAPGPPPHDRAAASGSRAPFMPCWGPWASARAPGLSRGRGVLASDARSKWVRWQARITAVAARFSLPFDQDLAPAFPSGSE
uniref:Uncharacterized protein n=1 Tax=Mustela putorius furo TaxID=9669 RepID=M3XQV2_MUSPF